MVAIFTYNNHTYDDKKRVEDQNIAYSTDRGRTWTKYAGNPVVPHPGNLTDFRDPKVFWHADHWVMVLAAGDRVLFYISPDLKHWELSGSFGGGYGSTDGVWETPDLFQLPVNGSDSRWVLTVGVGSGAYAGGSGTQYFIGDFDGKTFTSENPKETTLWMDHGPDFYAPQSWNDEPNGRRISIAWMNNWSYARLTPTETWRGAFTFPRELTLTQTTNGLRLLQVPVAELAYLHRSQIHWQDEIITPKHDLLAGIQGRSLEIDLEIPLLEATKKFGLRIFDGGEESTVISYQPEESLLYVDRTRSGRVDFHADFARLQFVPLLPIDGVIRLRILMDRSSVEVFANDGSVTLTSCIFPSTQSHALKLFVEEGYLHLNSLDIYFLEPADFNITSIE